MKMTVSGFDSSSISTLFSSISGSSGNSGLFGGPSSMLSDYYSIRNGSYQKLLKSYYSPETQSVSSKLASDKLSKLNAFQKEDVKQIKTDATALSDAANKLLEKGSKSLFNKVATTKEDGSTEYAYDTNAIYNAVSDFAKQYNSLIDSAKDSSIGSIENSVSNMMSMSSINANMLKKIGITFDENQRFVVDENKFKQSDMTLVKSLFNEQGGYGYQVATKASMVNASVAVYASGSNYTSAGTWNKNAWMNTYNSYI